MFDKNAERGFENHIKVRKESAKTVARRHSAPLMRCCPMPSPPTPSHNRETTTCGATLRCLRISTSSLAQS